MTTRRRTSLPAVCRCLPSDKSEASGETRRAGTWRWWRRRGDGRRSHSLCVIWGNLQINTTAWCSEPLSSPTSPHCISPSLPSPPLPPFSQPSWLCLSQASFISLWLHFWGMHGTGENYQWQQSHGRWKIDARNNFKMIMEILQVRSLGSLGGGGHHYPPFHRRVLWLFTEWKKPAQQLPPEAYIDRYQCQSVRPQSAWGLKGGAATYCTYKGQAFSMNRDTLSIHGVRNKVIKTMRSFRFVIPERCVVKTGGPRLYGEGWKGVGGGGGVIYECSISTVIHDVV